MRELWMLLPAVLLLPVWLAVSRAKSRLGSMARVFVAACVVTLFTLIFPRALLALYAHWAAWVLVVPAIAWNLWRSRSAPPFDRKTLAASIATAVISLVLTGFVVAMAAAAHHARGGGVTLHFPLRAGRYVIAHGGSNIILNKHTVNRAQSFALDITKVDACGFRARGLWPSDVHRYAIWGDPIYSPCAGRVILAVDEFEDLSPPDREPRRGGGNHVVVSCEGVSIELAHMMRGSVRVAVGEAVTPQTIVGAVGNSGNTSEPHLHIHAVRGEIADVSVMGKMGEPVPLYFDGRFLVRNDVVDAP